MTTCLRLGLLLVLGGIPANRLHADTALVFNEVMYHPATNEPAMEWVEFYNQMAVDLDVSGWRVTGDIAYAFPEGTRVAGQSYAVLAIHPEALAAATGLTSLLGPYTNRLSNAGGTLELRNANGRLMDQLRFGTRDEWPVAPDGAGVSLAKLDRDWGSAAPDHWAASAEVGGTPGRENFPGPAAPGLAVAFNETSGTADATFWVELLNRGPEPVTLAGWVLRAAGATRADFVLPESTSVEAGGFQVLDERTLGFRPSPGDRLFLYTPDRTRVADGVVVEAAPWARFPDGHGPWWRPAEPSPGAANRFRFSEDVVIHEIMYHPALRVAAPTGAPVPSDAQWIELYNRGTNVVDLGGWEFGGGIAYRFAVGQHLAPGGYLVVARDAAALRAEYPGVDIVGDFAGRLSRRGERIWLRDAAGNPADEVHYFDRGPWPAAADGGGSSLELRDPFADNARPEAWAASDESGKSAWETVRYRRVAGFPAGTQPTQWNDFILGLLNAGECLIDDLRVVETPAGTPVDLVSNGDFENGMTGWRALGTHRHSRVIADPDQPGNHVLHLVATGPQEHMHNHLETTLRNGRSVVNGREYEISFRARWLTGNPRLNTRLLLNRVAWARCKLSLVHEDTPGANSLVQLGPDGRPQHTPKSAPDRVGAGTDPQGVAANLAGPRCANADDRTTLIAMPPPGDGVTIVRPMSRPRMSRR
ncbi:MAG: lamin tail domain-containing protein [Verrucomicrobiales bacterium]|nr:lamin tail domain-containing protein [Verrucomicrobiales bacterium]